MKKSSVLLCLIIAGNIATSKNLTGYWNGVIKVPGKQFRIGFNINQTDKGFIATMDSPDQGVKRVKVSKTSLDNDVVKFILTESQIEYVGNFVGDDSISGTLTQIGHPFSVGLLKGIPDTLVRPQLPKKPHPYYTEDITFTNKKDKIGFSGTLTLPKKTGNFPAVVILSDFGSQNRNGDIADHKPYLVIADYLTKNGIAVLRFDDRGTGESQGDYKTASTLEFKSDVEAALEYLQLRPEVNKQHIGLIGHGEGAVIAPMIASKMIDIDFIVLLAGAGIPGNSLLLKQQESIGVAKNLNKAELAKSVELNKGAYDIIQKSANTDKLKSALKVYFKTALKDTTKNIVAKSVTLNQKLTKQDSIKIHIQDSINVKLAKADSLKKVEFTNKQIEILTSPWMQYFVKYNPALTLEKVKCPVLIYNGARDLQVSPIVNLDAMVAALQKGGNAKYDTKAFPTLNHYFQPSKTGLPSEYGEIEQTFSPQVLDEMTKWINIKIKE